jgi:hypothetical protein
VKVTKEEAATKLPGLGSHINTPIIGRHGGSFNNFGDYATNLFEHIDFHGDPPGRALFDMAAVAIVKDPSWASSTEIPCPKMVDKMWVEQAENKRKVKIWQNFEKEKIMADFYKSLAN